MKRKLMKAEVSEPMYDDVTLKAIKQQETEELIGALAEYCKSLENQVIELRCWVNRLTPRSQREPFPDPHSDLYEVFHGYAAYPMFEAVLKPLE